MKDFDSKLTTFFNQLDDRMKNYFPNMVAETAVEVFKESFKIKSWDGTPWPAYGNPRREPKKGSLMMRSNALFASIRPVSVTPLKVTINAGNSRVRYARIHNEGGRISGARRISAHYNNNYMGKGKRVAIKAHTRNVNYNMPQRRFMGKSQLVFNAITNRFKTSFKTF